MLQVEHLSRSFGGVKAIDDLSFSVKAGDIHAVIGPNGAGKTTLFNVITGVYAPSSGHVRMEGDDIGGKPPELLAKLGMSRTFQNLQVAMNLSALENVMLGAHLRLNHGVLAGMLYGRKLARAEREAREHAREYMTFAGVEQYANAQAQGMPFGALKRLEIARALAARPRLLLLDEPAAGLNHTDTAQISELIQRVSKEGVTVLLVEHDMNMVMSIANRILVLDFGKVLAEGSAQEVRSNPAVVEAYLGAMA
ncbi:high-affinity branched-chain amino acid ABC transporter ATP-binding protein LivG [Pandoraea cepalis]|uniref:High-affinity branched-chain amino acid ABC transporter ATP-binding protein LivG n=1 Tax=Pandoraea cepalis TaxID=2508294 RepID=A0AAW7MNG7_9BURK|nr:ABC transporter ATP-binding protein [Pandoraea cepalis]MDN4574106.1 high-affinity branched-chain amino acid ABC transporter ATP-binding protein LivG [Pandoraea cepalis]MDN4579610.1 high-affinity branched-chain amino acid ABC transporter ATP-binding protein LivG [Pandoraea cepalis]